MAEHPTTVLQMQYGNQGTKISAAQKSENSRRAPDHRKNGTKWKRLCSFVLATILTWCEWNSVLCFLYWRRYKAHHFSGKKLRPTEGCRMRKLTGRWEDSNIRVSRSNATLSHRRPSKGETQWFAANCRLRCWAYRFNTQLVCSIDIMEISADAYQLNNSKMMSVIHQNKG